MIEKINRELVRITNLSGLTPIDDYNYLQSKTLYTGEIYRLRTKGTKTYPKKNFHTTLYIYEADNQKASLYREADKFLTLLEEEFFKDEKEYNFSYNIQREASQKIYSDKGKFYQYSIQLYITVY